MENIGGGLGFRATLDIDDFNVSALAMERRIKEFSSKAIDDVGNMEDSFKRMAENAGRYISYYLVGQGMQNIASSIIQTRGQFQQLEIAFETMLGSGSEAQKLMGELTDTAAKTPFDLTGVAEGAKQLMAYGVGAEEVNDTLVRLGNIASGLSIPLNDIVYLYGTTMVQGRLYAQDVRQFTGRGIPLVKELADMYHKNVDEINAMVSAGKIGFADVEKVLRKMTDEGGQFYNLMEKQSSSLTGQIANLQDAWDMALNDLGKSGEGLFSGAIQSVTYFVEHMDDVIRILKSIAIGYGSVRAAIALNSVATKGYTGIALLDNTVRSAKLALMKAEEALNGTSIAQKNAMTAAENAHFQALEATLTAEQQANILSATRVAAIQSLLTAQQQQYLSNINLTTSSAGYEAAAMAMLTADQRLALSKMDLTAKGAGYRAAIMQEVAAKQASQAASLETMRITVKEAAIAVEAAKSKAIAANQAVEAARYDVYWAKQSGNATSIAAAQKKLDAAVDQQKITRSAALAAQTDFFTKKKQLETLAIQQSRVASAADTAAKEAQTAASNILSAATGKITSGLKALWATMVANPIGAILSLVGLLASAFMMLSDSEDEANESASNLNDSSEKQISHLSALFGTIKAGTKGTNTYKKAIEEVNAQLKEHNLALLGSESTMADIEAAQKRLASVIKAENAEIERDNALKKIADEYSTALDELGNKIQKELQEAHHYESNFGVGMSFDSEDIQKNATALAGQIRGVIEDSLESMVNLPDDKKAAAKAKLRQQITDVMTAAGIDKEHAQFITDYSFLDDWFYDVFSEDGGIIDQAVTAKEAFVNQSKAANEAAESILRMANVNANELAPKADLAKFSLEELHDFVTELSGSECNIDIKVYGYESAMQMLADVQSQINLKQNNLNTESGISSEIQNLKKLRGEAVLGSQAWKDYNSQIDRLQEKLDNATGNKKTHSISSPKIPNHRTTHNKADDAARNAEAFAKAQREADWKLEEARISTLEEGYEKRKATLDLQFKKEIQRIKDEEKSFEETRKKAGKGGLTKDEKQNFESQIKYATDNYNRDAAKLFDGELDYKRKQYELYWRWVENMGKETADKQFADLLKSGSSFKNYLDKKIATLEAKQEDGTITDAETQFLFSLNVDLDELQGGKSALDRFKESVDETINQSQTLAEKIKAVAAAKKQLENGESHLNEDDRMKAFVDYDKQEAELQKELQKTLLTDYRTYEEQRLSIQEQYSLLRTAAEKKGDTQRIALINEAEQQAISALNTNFLQQSDSWKKLFSDLDTLSVAEIQKLIKDIENQVNSGNLKLSPVDYKAVIDSLEKAKARVQELNPFASLDAYFNDYIAAKKKLAAAQKNLAEGKGSEQDVADAQREVKAAANGISESVEKVTDISTECATSLQNVFDALGMDNVTDGLGTAIELMGELGNAAASVGKFMAGDIVGGITGMISSVTSIVGIFAKLHDAKYEKKIQNLQRQIDALDRSYSRLERAFNNTYWVFNEEERAGFEKNISLIEEQIAALEQQREVAKKTWRFGEYADITAQLKQLRQELEKAKSGDDMLGLYKQQLEALEMQKDLINQQINAENAKKKTDKDKIIQWENAIEDIDAQMADMQKSMIETFAGTSTKEAIDQFADAIVEAYCAGEDAAKALGDTTREVLKKAVVDALKRNFLAKAMDDAVKYLGDAMSDGELTDREKSKFEAMVNAAGETFTNALEAVGGWIKDVEDSSVSDPLTGAVTSMSEETGGVIAGRLNAFIINQTDQTNVLRQQLLQQSAIAQNTATANTILTEIKDTLSRIETKDNSLLSQGIS